MSTKTEQADARHAEREEVEREIATLTVRLEHLEPAEREAQQIRARLAELS